MLLGIIAVFLWNFDIIILIIFLSIYVFLILFFRKISNNKNHHLIVHEEMMEINYSNDNKVKYSLTINYDDIIKIEYYKLFSIFSLLNLINGVVPKCVFVTYTKYVEEVCELIGHMDLQDIKKITNDKKIKLIVK